MTALQLGEVLFEDFEIPESINFGGPQRLGRKQLPGGYRIVDAMGADDAPIGWEGRFLGAQAVYRARALDFMRKSGSSYLLQWHEFRYTVVIESFEAEFHAFYDVPYRLVLCVIEDGALPIVEAPRNALDMSIREDLIETTLAVQAIQDQPLSELDATLQSVAKGIQDFRQAAYEAISPVLNVASDIRARVRVLQQTAGAALNGAAAFVSIVPGLGTSGLVRGLREASSAAVQLPALWDLDNRILRITRNLNVADFGLGVVTRTVSGATTLFGVAAQEYGDARRWTDIAGASGLSDPQVTRTRQIRIPQR